MSIVSWNCRGLAAPATVSELINICKKIKPAIVFLIETRAKEKNVSRIKRRLHFENMFCVEPRGLSGGLSLFWNEKYDVEVYFWNDNLIKAYVDDRKDNRWIGNFVYGCPNYKQRRK